MSEGIADSCGPLIRVERVRMRGKVGKTDI